MTDLRLFHHYMVAAYPHLPVRNDNIWLTYVTPISHQYDHVMHAQLALAASHLNKLTSCGLTDVALSHRLAAIKGLNSILDRPLQNAEDGDAIIATCYALLMQSWYMDDGLQSFLIYTRSCNLMMEHVRDQQVESLFAQQDPISRVESMRSRLKGAPVFDLNFLRFASLSLNALRPICRHIFERELLTSLRECVTSLSQSPLEAYLSLDEVNGLLTNMNPTELEQLMEPRNIVSQFLLAHLIALYLIMRPLVCRERKVYTVTMYGIRMSNWIETIRMQVGPDHQQALAWPSLVNQLHLAGTLEQYALTHEPQPTQSTAFVMDGCRSVVEGYLNIV